MFLDFFEVVDFGAAGATPLAPSIEDNYFVLVVGEFDFCVGVGDGRAGDVSNRFAISFGVGDDGFATG